MNFTRSELVAGACTAATGVGRIRPTGPPLDAAYRRHGLDRVVSSLQTAWSEISRRGCQRWV